MIRKNESKIALFLPLLTRPASCIFIVASIAIIVTSACRQLRNGVKEEVKMTYSEIHEMHKQPVIARSESDVAIRFPCRDVA